MSGHKAVLVDEGFLLKLIRDSKFEIPDNLMDKMASSSRKMDSALASDSRAFDQVNNYNDELVSFQIAKDKNIYHTKLILKQVALSHHSWICSGCCRGIKNIAEKNWHTEKLRRK